LKKWARLGLRGILAPAAGNAVVTARITIVELHSALARRL
jgi:hypothetical protein